MKIIKRFFIWLGTILAVIVTTVAALLALSIKWMLKTWAHLSMDELLFHLTAPLEGTNQDLILEYINECLVPAVLILLLYSALLMAFRKTKKYAPGAGLGIILSVLVCAFMLYSAWTKLDVGGYVEAKSSDRDFIAEHYVDPADVEITFPEEKRNLIYIFLESMETTYADKMNGGAFEQNVIPELTAIAQENEDFSGESTELNGPYTMWGSSWTMGAMFSQTSGLPLNIPIEVNDMDTQSNFFPGILTIGDILEQEGYSQTLLCGSEAKFGGRELYFKDHGNYDIIDYTYALDNGMIPAGYKVWWGFEDQKLFGFAKEKLLELSAQEEPFNLTMLTVDTHFEDGWVCEQCPETFGGDQYSNVMACASRQLAEFINWIQAQSFYEDTTIVLAGDHLTMDSDYCTGIDSEYERRNYVAYINPAKTVQNNEKRMFNTLDQFPTTLSALGAEISGDRLGMGTDLFSDTPTLIEEIGWDSVDTGLRGNSPFMEEKAQIDMNVEELKRRDGRLPNASIWTEEYRYDTGELPVFVKGITGVSEEVKSVVITAWTETDKSDMQWSQLETGINDFGKLYYYGYVNISDFGYKTGEYQIQAYAIDSEGEHYLLGDATGIVY